MGDVLLSVWTAKYDKEEWQPPTAATGMREWLDVRGAEEGRHRLVQWFDALSDGSGLTGSCQGESRGE